MSDPDNNDPDQSPWNRLVSASRPASENNDGEHPPEGFVAHMRKVRGDLWGFARTLLWRRGSLIAIVVALLLYLLAHFFLKSDPAPSVTPPKPRNPISAQ